MKKKHILEKKAIRKSVFSLQLFWAGLLASKMICKA
jgi:hypothetical protein